jgi:hypothetical protein
VSFVELKLAPSSAIDVARELNIVSRIRAQDPSANRNKALPSFALSALDDLFLSGII